MYRTIHAVLVYFGIVTTLSTCPPGSIQGLREECYLFFYDALTWFQAEERCVRESGHLASVQNAFDNGFISELPVKRFGWTFWLGGSAGMTSSTWSWSDGTPFSYQNWGKGQPTSASGCLVLNVSDTKWIPTSCEDTNNFICKVGGDEEKPVTQAPKKPPCPSEWTYFGPTKKCYKAFHGSYTLWPEAEQTCVNDGAHLVSIHSPEEQQFISQIAGTGVPMGCWTTADICDDGVWIGLNDRRRVGVYEWPDGTSYNYANWHSGSPVQVGYATGTAYFPDAFAAESLSAWADRWEIFNLDIIKMRAFVCNMNASTF